MDGGSDKSGGARAALAAIAAAITLAGACSTPPAPGEFGTFRLVGHVKGAVPLSLLPPATDRSGNVYILYGGVDLPETEVYVGKNGGGWTSGCALTKGDSYGAHGWVGFDDEHEWYWSGDALVSVSGRTSDCHRVLDHDPGTDANLLFRAVLPWVRAAPSRTTLVTLVQSPLDALPFSARVDLESEILTNIDAFEPHDAADLKILGVGADPAENEGVVLLQYTLGGDVRTEARFYDEQAKLLAAARIPLPAAAREYTVRGFLQVSSGLVAGLLDTDDLVTFDRSGGRVVHVDKMKPVGVHKWNEDLWVVGTGANHPVLSRLDDNGGMGPVQIWTASEQAAGNLGSPITVRDDRELPSTTSVFSSPRTAMGDFPFLHEHSLALHAPDTTLWLVAGPSFDTGGAKVTAFAMAPVGVTYP